MISVIIPVYNAEKYLDACLESISKQTVQDMEIILVNDGSTDGSLAICQAWAERDNRFRWYTKENGGVSSARNLGAEKATGSFLTYVDSDDVLREDYCEKLLAHMTDGTDLVVLGMCRMNRGGTIPISFRMHPGVYKAEELKKYIIDDGTMSGFTFPSACSVLYRKSILAEKDIHFRQSVRYNEDGLYNAEYVLACENEIYVDFTECIYFYRVNQSSATKTADLLSGQYQTSMDGIDGVLRAFIGAEDPCDIQKQLSRRHVSLALDRILYAVRTGKEDQVITDILTAEKARAGLREVRFAALSLKKKGVYILLRVGCVPLIRFVFEIVAK